MNFKKSITTIFALCLLVSSFAEESVGKYHNRKSPKLMVQIVVGGLRFDQLYRYKDNLTENGFKKLMFEGANCINARYGYMLTQPECGIATLVSGTHPSGHGIVGKQWVNFTTNVPIMAIEDTDVIGVGANEDEANFSSKTMAVSTIGDELKQLKPTSKVVSIAMDPADAVFAAGKKSDGCYWYDERYGAFVTSSFYKQTLPNWVAEFNNSKLKEGYANELWSIERDYERYIYRNASSILLDSAKKFSFDKIFKPNNRDYAKLKEVPSGNSYTKDFVIETIKKEGLGEDDVVDYLVVSFGAQRNIAKLYGSQTTEAEDSFYKLDKNIAELISFLEEKVGAGNFVINLTSSHGISDNTPAPSSNDKKRFSTVQFRVIISGFLNAQLGSDNWVTDYKNRQIYLNRRLIYEKGLSLTDIQNRVATFALQFEGISHAVTATTLQSNYYGKGVLQKMQNSFFPRNSGDIMINILPGWIEVDLPDDVDKTSLWGSPYEYDTHVPLIWYGGGIKPQIIQRNIDMIDVAPTISDIIGITYPNATEGVAINELVLLNNN